MTAPVPILVARDLVKHFPVRKGLFGRVNRSTLHFVQVVLGLDRLAAVNRERQACKIHGEPPEIEKAAQGGLEKRETRATSPGPPKEQAHAALYAFDLGIVRAGVAGSRSGTGL